MTVLQYEYFFLHTFYIENYFSGSWCIFSCLNNVCTTVSFAIFALITTRNTFQTIQIEYKHINIKMGKIRS